MAEAVPMRGQFRLQLSGSRGIGAGFEGRIDAEEYARREYGPRVGIWRILRLLDKYQIKATFVTCGALAERYPESVKAIHAAGHDVAGHGYHHEKAWKLTEEEEIETMRKTVNVLTGLTGIYLCGGAVSKVMSLPILESARDLSGQKTVFPRSTIPFERR